MNYVHAVCSGFVEYTTCVWFDSRSARRFSPKNKISVTDQRLLCLQLIYEMSRLPQLFLRRRYWKSQERHNWLLYYSPVVLRAILSAVYFKNWIKFVHIMHFLLMESIPFDQLAKKNDLFAKGV